MRLLASLSIRGGLLAMVGVGSALGLVLLLTALLCLQAFRDDVRTVSDHVGRATAALARLSAAQSAFQTQQRGLNAMLLRNYMATEFEKGQAEFAAGRSAFWQEIDALETLHRGGGLDAGDGIARIRPLAAELNQLYDQVLAENEPGMPKYTLMVDAALRDADTPLVGALAETFAAISRSSTEGVATASTVAGRRFTENALLVLSVGLAGSALFLALAAAVGRRILGRLGGELEPVVEATRRVAAGDLTEQLDSGRAAASSLVAAIGDM
ncbi:MAG TPA: hypothetical protein VF096_08225, partial [Azonexus sp.]